MPRPFVEIRKRTGFFVTQYPAKVVSDSAGIIGQKDEKREKEETKL